MEVRPRVAPNLLLFIMSLKSEIFRRILPYTTEGNVRVIRPNLRDYPGSSRFSPEELARFRSEDPVEQTAAIRDFGLSVIAFLDYLITTYAIPPGSMKDGKKCGGIAVVSWSYANILSLSILAHAGSIFAATQYDLTKYIRTFVLYGERDQCYHLQ